MSDTPTVDQAFGSIPTSEEAFGPDKEQNHSGSFSDYFWSSTPSNRILSAFGQGLKNGWGAGPVGLSQETQDDLRKRGWFNDYNSGRTSILKSANEAWIRPIASTLDAALRAGSAALGGLAQGTYQVGKEIGQPKLGEAGAGIIEYLGTTGAPELALPHTAGIPAETLTRGRAEAVIGEGEHGYFNTKDASPEQIQDRAEATGSLPEEPVTAQKDIHQVAREIAPEVFSAYDEAKGYNNYYRNQLDVLKEAQPENPRVSELNTQIDDILSKVNGVEDKLTNKASDRLDSLRSELLDTPAKIDTEEMAVIRAKMMEHDYNMRDLAPDVAYAYRQAQEKLGSEAVEGPQETVPAQASTETPTSETASPGAPQTPLGGTTDSIKDQVVRQLIAAGRPAEEAEAAGQLLEAHYNARADRFKGKLGSGLELFNKEGPEIKAGGEFKGRGKTTLNQYAGSNAFKGTDEGLQNSKRLSNAVKLESEGKSPEEIRKETGWFKGKYDKKWRFEISDSGADLMPAWQQLTESKLIGEKFTTTLDKILAHPDLYKAYPELKNVTVTKQRGFLDVWGTMQGWFDSEKNLLNITPNAKKPISVALHEIQHWIQSKEGFARGGNQNTILEHLTPEKIKDLAEEQIPILQKKIEEVARDLPTLKRFQKEVDITESNRIYDESKKASEAYHALPKDLPYNDPTKVKLRGEWLDSAKVYEDIVDATLEEYVGTDKYNEVPEDKKDLYFAIKYGMNGTGEELSRKIKQGEEKFVELQDTLTKLQSGDEKVLKEFVKENAAFKLYQSIAGEIEARDTQARQTLTPEQRLEQEPYSSEGIPEEDAIVTYHQKRRGSLTINKEKNTIRLFKDSDPSTFLHETGHQWLEELIQDGKHPEAPLELKSDVDSVRKWLRNDGEGITRKQHEQFARGFERYLMEGVAPSKELVSVFQKFKDWLTKIYQTVLNLKSPINDSIRDVFDRLITNNPEKTVVAPERDINEGPNDTAQFSSPVSQVTKEAVNKDNAPAVTSKAVSEQDKPIGGQDIIKDKSTPYVDKAGNINLDKITDNLDVKQTLRDITDQHPEITEATKGKISFKDQIDLAQAAGLKASEINVEKLRAMSVEDGIPLSSRIYGLRQMLVQSSKNLFELMKGDDAVAYAEAVQRHIMIQQTVSGVTAEVGRALGSFRIMADEAQKAQQLSEFLKANVGKTLYQLQDEMKLGKFLDTPDKVSGFVRDTNRASYGQMLLETFRNWLISGPITHATYALGNKLYAFYKAVPETAAQAIVGALHEAVAPLKEGELKRVTAGEVQEGLYTMLYAQKDGLKATWDSFKAGQTLGLPGEGSIYDLAHRQAMKKKLEGQEFTDRVEVLRKRYVTDMAYRQANKEGIPQMTPGGQGNPEYLRRVEDIINDPKSNDLIIDQKYTTPFTNTKAIPGALGTLVRIPGERMVAPLHSFDRTVGYLTNRNKFAFRQAVQEGLQGQDRAKRIIELQSDPDIMRRARNEATEQTLMGQSKSNFMRAVQGVLSWEADLPLLGKTQPLKFISPFATVAANINRLAIIDRSPLGYLISKDLRDTINGKNGRFAQDEAIAKMGLGTAFYGTVGGLVLDGTVQPSADKDRNKARIDAVTKGLPHSIRVGEMSYALDRLGILGNMFGLAADMFEVARYAYDTHEYTKAGVAALHAIYNHVAEEGFMSGISDMLKAADEPDRYGGRWINNFLSTASVPFSVGSYQIARQIDPYQREVHGYIDSVKSKIPFVSETLPAKVDVFGNPVPSKEYYGVYAEHIDNDPAYQVLTQAGYFPAPVKDNIRGVKLTADQYHEYASKAGFLLKQQLDGIVSNENFSNLTAYTKHELIKEAITSSRSTAASIVQMKSINTDNDLIKKAIENQQNLIKGNK